MRTITTAAYSPFSNSVLKKSFYKIHAEHPDLDADTILAASLAAHNNLHNVHGFTPAQIAFGFNPAFGGVNDAKLPVLESNGVSEFVVSRIRAIENAESSILKQNTVNVSAKH